MRDVLTAVSSCQLSLKAIKVGHFQLSLLYMFIPCLRSEDINKKIIHVFGQNAELSGEFCISTLHLIIFLKKLNKYEVSIYIYYCV